MSKYTFSKGELGGKSLEAVAKKLSWQQKRILKYLVEYMEWIDEYGTEFGRGEARNWGVPWKPGKWNETWENTHAASYSRALRRLEKRGLVLRNNDISGRPDTGEARRSMDDPHNRTVRVLITDAGWEVGKRLTKAQG